MPILANVRVRTSSNRALSRRPEYRTPLLKEAVQLVGFGDKSTLRRGVAPLNPWRPTPYPRLVGKQSKLGWREDHIGVSRSTICALIDGSSIDLTSKYWCAQSLGIQIPYLILSYLIITTSGSHFPLFCPWYNSLLGEPLGFWNIVIMVSGHSALFTGCNSQEKRCSLHTSKYLDPSYFQKLCQGRFGVCLLQDLPERSIVREATFPQGRPGLTILWKEGCERMCYVIPQISLSIV